MVGSLVPRCVTALQYPAVLPLAVVLPLTGTEQSSGRVGMMGALRPAPAGPIQKFFQPLEH